MMLKTSTNYTAYEAALHQNATRGGFVKTLFWRLATLAFRLPSPQLGLTAVFGMRTGVTPAINHQNRVFNSSFVPVIARNMRCDLSDKSPEQNLQRLHFNSKELRPKGTSIFLSGLPLRKMGALVENEERQNKAKALTRLSQFLSRVLSTY